MNLEIITKNKKKFIGILILLCLWGSLYGWWKYQFPSATWNYKLTVTVETPEGIKTGSAVREITVAIRPVPMDKRRPWRSNISVKGEAVVVDLGNRGTLFAVLDGDDAYHVVFNTFPYIKGGGTPEGAAHYAQLKAGPSVIKQIPTMVTFKDMKDPKTVVAVDRANLAGTFGKGVKLKDVTIEMTDEDVTWGIGKHLVWLDSLNANLDGSDVTTGSSYANTLHVGYFKVGGQ
jgi:hypothetical protein